MSDPRGPAHPPDDDSQPSDAAATDAAPEVRACNELGMILGSELAQVEEEIERVRGIIAEAVAELSSSFDQMYHLCADTHAGTDDSNTLDQAASGAIRALQFEDITAQALAEALRSVAYLRGVAEEVRTAHDAGELAERIRRQHRLWAEIRRKAVLQENLDEGSVDLF